MYDIEMVRCFSKYRMFAVTNVDYTVRIAWNEFHIYHEFIIIGDKLNEFIIIGQK